MAYIGKTPVIGNFVKLDAISVVNGQAAYTMQNASVNFTSYENVNQFLVSLNGILQAPTDSFTVSGSTITFASNLVTGDVIDFIIVLGNTLDIGTPSDNTVTTAKLADSSVSLAKLTATGTKDATTFLRGDNTFATVVSGLTVADQWRLTASITSDGNAAFITSNLERVDTAGQGYIAGSLMSESSGVFTFPSTGIYNVTSNMIFQGIDHADTAMDNDIYITINNSSYTHVARTQMGQQGDSSANTGCVASTLVDVTDTANVKVKFAYSSVNNNNVIQGGTTENRTFFTFIRLGDT
jgi:hypothetical protein